MRGCRFSDFHDEIMNAYSRPDDESSGKSSGWPGLDPFYKVRTMSAGCSDMLICKDMLSFAVYRWLALEEGRAPAG